MRVLYLHQYFNVLRDVGGTRSYEMARRLVAWGHEVHMVTSVRDRGVKNRGWWVTQEEGINVHWLPVPYSNAMPYGARIRAFLRFAWGAAHRAASIPADVVFATSTPLTIALPAVYAARRQHIPMVFEVRDLWPEIPIALGAIRGPILIGLARWLERFAYRNSARIVTLSPGMREGVIKAGYPPERVTIIPNGADLDLFGLPATAGQSFREQFEWLGSRPLVVYTGTVGRVNGVGYLAHLAHYAAHLDPSVRFLVVGDGTEWDLVKTTAERLNVLNCNFHMMHGLPKREIPCILSAAQLATSLVINIPQLWSNSANKFFDALASGTPVAINYCGWQADLLADAGAGIVLDPIDIQGSAELLIGKLQDTEWLKRASHAARELAEKRFARDLLAKQLEEVLLEAIAEGVKHIM